MPRNERISTFEKGEIVAHHANCWSDAAIQREIDRSRGVVTAFLRDQKPYNKRNVGSGRPTVTDADERLIICDASHGKIGVAGNVKTLKLTVTPRRVRKVWRRAAFSRYKRILITPAMKACHEEKRVGWATEKKVWSTGKWSTIVWSDEKKFHLDGPDRLA